MSAIAAWLHPGRIAAMLGLIGWATAAIVRASLQVARDVVAPSARIAPVVLVVPLRTRSRVEVATVSGLITLTPGTLPVGITESTIWVHGVYGRDPDQLRREIEQLQTRVLRGFRHPESVAETS
jgi:multisubunit Na+/H+ antiporter MnhE subunit